jgi:hypothetical protein
MEVRNALGMQINCFTMKTGGYFSSVTPTFPHSENVSMSNTKQYVELKAVPFYISSIV